MAPGPCGSIVRRLVDYRLHANTGDGVARASYDDLVTQDSNSHSAPKAFSASDASPTRIAPLFNAWLALSAASVSLLLVTAILMRVGAFAPAGLLAVEAYNTSFAVHGAPTVPFANDASASQVNVNC